MIILDTQVEISLRNAVTYRNSPFFKMSLLDRFWPRKHSGSDRGPRSRVAVHAHAPRLQEVPKFGGALTAVVVVADADGGAGRADEHVPAACDSAVARERAQWRGRRSVAGFPLTVPFEYHGGPAYVRWRRRVRRAAGPVHPAIERQGDMGNDDSGFFDTRCAADYLALSPRTLDGYSVGGAGGRPSTASGAGCAIAGRFRMNGRRNVGPQRRRRPTGSHPYGDR